MLYSNRSSLPSRRGCWTHLDGSLELEQDGLRDEDFAGLSAKISNLSLEQLHLLARPAASDLQEPVYDGVKIHLVFGHSWDWLRVSVSVRKVCFSEARESPRAGWRGG